MDVIRIAITIAAAAFGAWLLWGCYLLQSDRERCRAVPGMRAANGVGATREGLAPFQSRAS